MSSLPFATSVRSLNRLRQIAQVLTHHGFGHIVERLNLGRLLPLRKRVTGEATAPPVEPTSMGRRLAAVCVDLGPTFVKLGQMISTRPDLVSREIMKELRKLQDRVPPFDSEEAMRIVAEEIGAPIAEKFKRFEPTPFASGSVAQVHRAELRNGREVVVKVKRPGIDDTIRHDLQLVRWLASGAQQWVSELRRYRPVLIVDEFEDLLAREMDFTAEASYTTRFEEAFADDPNIIIPHVYWELSGPRVLTLAELHGEKFEAILAEQDGRIDRKALARRLVEVYLKQFFDLRTFHADPHPGNFLIRPPARIGIVDFGQVATLSDDASGQMMVMILALIYREPQVFVDVLADLGGVEPETDVTALVRSLRHLLDKYHGVPLRRIDLVGILSQIGEAIRAHGAVLPREMVMVLKTLVTIGGVALQLDPEMDLVGVVKPRVKHVIAQRMTPARLMRMATVASWHLSSILRSAPSQLRNALRNFGRGRWQIAIRHENLERLTDELDRSSNRMATAIVIGSVIVGSSVVVSAKTNFPILGIPLQWFGVAGYLFAGFLGVTLLWAIFRSGRLH